MTVNDACGVGLALRVKVAVPPSVTPAPALMLISGSAAGCSCCCAAASALAVSSTRCQRSCGVPERLATRASSSATLKPPPSPRTVLSAFSQLA